MRTAAPSPSHHHLGTQVARIVSGTLTYTVRKGRSWFAATLLKTGAPPATPVTLSSRPR